jgi:hypothetical protein
MSTPSEKEHQALEAIVHRASVDREFRQRLLTDPRQAIQEAYGVVIPPNFRIKFIERDPGIDALIVLPDLKSATGEGATNELSDHDLEAVSGGVDTDPTWSNAIVDNITDITDIGM